MLRGTGRGAGARGRGQGRRTRAAPRPVEPCPICYQPINSSFEQFRCGHFVCNGCFSTALNHTSATVRLTVERCPLCRAATGFNANLTSAERTAIEMGIEPAPSVPAGPTVQTAAPASEVDATATAIQAFNNMGLVVAPVTQAVDAQHAIDRAVVSNAVRAQMANIQHAVSRRYLPTLGTYGIGEMACAGLEEYDWGYAPGGFVSLVDGGVNPHAVLHQQRRAIYSWWLHLSENRAATHVFIDVGGRPDIVEELNHRNGRGTWHLNSRWHYMCPTIMDEDFDRVEETQKYVMTSRACRCALGKDTCELCTAFDDRSVVYTMMHSLYYIDPAVIADACQTAEVWSAHHRFAGFRGSFEYKRGYASKKTEATWERVGDSVTMNVEGNEYTYTHNALSWLRVGHALETPKGCFKWCRIVAVGDYSVGSDPMEATAACTEVYRFTRCEVDLVRRLLPPRRVHVETRDLDGTRYEYHRDGLGIQIIATGAITGNATLSYEVFDRVARIFCSQNPSVAMTHAAARARAHVEGRDIHIVLGAARAYTRRELAEVAFAVSADGPRARAITDGLSGRAESFDYGGAAGAIVGAVCFRNLSGAVVGWYLGNRGNEIVRASRALGWDAALTRAGVTPVTAAVLAATTALLLEHRLVELLRPLGGVLTGDIISTLCAAGRALYDDTREHLDAARARMSADLPPLMRSAISATGAAYRNATAKVNDGAAALQLTAANATASSAQTARSVVDGIKQSALTRLAAAMQAVAKAYPRTAAALSNVDPDAAQGSLAHTSRAVWIAEAGTPAVGARARMLATLAAALLAPRVFRAGKFADWLTVLSGVLTMCGGGGQMLNLVSNVRMEEVLKDWLQRQLRRFFPNAPAWSSGVLFGLFEYATKLYAYRQHPLRAAYAMVTLPALFMHAGISCFDIDRRTALHLCFNILVCRILPSAPRNDLAAMLCDGGGATYPLLRFGAWVAGQGWTVETEFPPVSQRADSELREPSPHKQATEKPKPMMVVAPVAHPASIPLPAAIAWTAGNERRALTARVLMAVPLPQEQYLRNNYQQMVQFLLPRLCGNAPVYSIPRVDWENCFPPRRREQLRAAYEAVRADPLLGERAIVDGVSTDPARKRLFLKVEQTGYGKDPRAIQASLDTALVQCGPWFMSLSRRLCEAGDASVSIRGIRYIMAIGRTKTEAMRMFYDAAQTGENVIMVTGDDCAVYVHAENRAFSLDAKRWDAHCHRGLQEPIIDWYERVSCPRNAVRLLRLSLDRHGTSVLGFWYSVDGTVASGNPDTIQTNSLSGIVVMTLAVRLGIPFRHALNLVSEKLGLVYEATDDAGIDLSDLSRWNEIEFCSAYPVLLADGTVGATPKLGRVLYRFGLSVTGQDPIVALRSKAMSLKADARHNTVLTRYANLALAWVGAGRVSAGSIRWTERMTDIDVDVDRDHEEMVNRVRYGATTAELCAAVERVWIGFAACGRIEFEDALLIRAIERDT